MNCRCTGSCTCVPDSSHCYEIWYRQKGSDQFQKIDVCYEQRPNMHASVAEHYALPRDIKPREALMIIGYNNSGNRCAKVFVAKAVNIQLERM